MGKRAHKRRANDSSDDEDRKPSAAKKPKAESNEHKIPTLRVPDWSKVKPFKKNFWTGPAGSEEPSEELKMLRKEVGVVVKGNLAGCPPPVLTADAAGLPKLISAHFQANNLRSPTSVQKQAWPAILSGSNVLAVAPTGSGKTLAFTLPLAHMTMAWAAAAAGSPTAPKGARPLGLVLLPTRELALQVVSVVKGLRRSCSDNAIPGGLGCAVLYGGQNKQDQVDKMLALGAGLHILIATPGRLLDVLQSDAPTLLSEIRGVVVDEADRMLTLGFREQLDAVLSVVRPDRQTVLFTATFPSRLREACDVWAPNAAVLRCAAIQIQDTLQQRRDAQEQRAEEEEEDEAHPVDGDDEGEQTTIAQGTPQEGDADADADGGEGNVDDGDADDADDSHVERSGQSSVAVSPLVRQHIHICAAHKRPRLLLKFLERIQAADRSAQKRQRSGVVIFANTIKTLRFVQDLLRRQGAAGSNYNNENGSHKSKQAAAAAAYRVAMLHGQLPQPRREEELLKFRSGKADFLLATDVAARGLDIKRVNYVINYDFPSSIEQYCHRIGRTGRDQAQPSGEAYSLFTRNYTPLAKELVHLLRACQQPVEKNLLAIVESMDQSGEQHGEEDGADPEEGDDGEAGDEEAQGEESDEEDQ